MTDEREPLAVSISSDDDTPSADELVDRARDSGGDEVLSLRRVGATPYLRLTPYTNNRGVTVNMWSCISVTGKPMPENTLLFHSRIIDPTEHDGYPLRMFTTPWVRRQARHTRAVRLYAAEDTPFAGDMLRWQ